MSADTFHTSDAMARELGGDPHRRRRDPLLDRPSDATPQLDALMSAALGSLLLTADGSAMRLDEPITSGEATDQTPRSALAREVEHFRRRYAQATTHRGRLEVIRDAQAHAAKLRYGSADPSLVRGSVQWRRRIAEDSRPFRVLTGVYGISKRDLCRFKREFRCPSTDIAAA